MEPAPSEPTQQRHERIKVQYGVDIDDPFTHLIFPDGTVQWEPVTIVMGWLALVYAEECGDIEPGEGYRLARLRVRQLDREDWAGFQMAVRAFGIKLVDAGVE